MLTGVVNMKFFYLFIFIFCVAQVSLAQSTRDVKPEAPAPKYQSQKTEKKKGFLGLFKKKNKKAKQKTQEEEVAAFRERLKEVYKQKAKDQKEAEKPQYSNPMYFGHKKPPKKRPPDKMKFCKECGIKH